jgi:hypothetical protein
VYAVYMLLLAYPLLTLWILVTGGYAGGDGTLLTAVMSTVIAGAVVSVFVFRHLLQRDEKKRKQIAKKLSETDPTSDKFEDVFKEAFEAHDLYATGLPALLPISSTARTTHVHVFTGVRASAERRHIASRRLRSDSSGGLDSEELRTLLKAIFGKVRARPQLAPSEAPTPLLVAPFSATDLVSCIARRSVVRADSGARARATGRRRVTRRAVVVCVQDREVFSAAMEQARAIGSASGGSLSIDACHDLFFQLEAHGHTDKIRRQSSLQRQPTVCLRRGASSDGKTGFSVKRMFSKKSAEPKIQPVDAWAAPA